MPNAALSRKQIDDIIKENGYLNPKVFPDGTVSCLMPLMFTVAIIHDINQTGYDDRWCYKDFQSALEALDEWDGEGEPDGWHRHPVTGRRRDGEKEWIAP